ncbi:MAG: amino acid adenylation domain-containing protein [Lachnospiraceae bacterium]|nr:amino acid adenylation domain-containing protein [Lachnospiraceae bacterium]
MKYNNTPDLCIHAFFAEQAERTPDQIAVMFGEKLITYQELDELSTRIATYLIKNIASPCVPIPLLVSSGIEMIAFILGILKAGCYYVPINKNDPSERIALILNEIDTNICLADSYFSEAGYTVYYTNDILQAINMDWSASLSFEQAVNSDLFGYMIFTSGTSGKPKAVRITHKNAMNSLFWRKCEYGLGTDDTVLQLFSYAFDGFVASLFTPLFSGSTVVIIDDGNRFNIEFICREIYRHKITHFISVPSVCELILLQAAASDLESLRIITLAGEMVSPRFFEIRKKYPEIEFVNEYGPTEASIVATYCRPMKLDNLNCIGRPINNTAVFILDDELNIKPIGSYGEICISGQGVSDGYMNDEKLNREKFITDNRLSDRVIYLTGDVGRYQSDGTIEIIGRKDNQVKLHGFRIELDEIRLRLLLIDGIEEAASLIVARESDSYLYAILKTSKNVPDDLVRKHLADHLPYYMIPQVILYIDEMPKSDSGKIDMAALRDIVAKTEKNVAVKQPNNETEKKLCEIWNELFNINNVGVDQNFFQLGGHSLKATILISHIYSKLHISLPLNQIFKTPTIKELAAVIKETNPKEYVPIEYTGERGDYPLSSEQMRMLFLHNESNDAMNYNVPVVFYIEGKLDLNRLKYSLNQLVLRHEALRTSVKWHQNDVMQTINECNDIQIHYENVDQSSIDERISAQFQIFDLAKAPLFNVSVLSNGICDYLIFDIHHLIIDGTSLTILIKELCTIYNGNPLGQVKLQYRDYVNWQGKRKSSYEYHKAKMYWQERIQPQKMKPLELPYDPKPERYPKRTGARHKFYINESLRPKIKEYIEAMDVTPFIFYHTCLSLLLHRYVNSNEITIGTSVAGRNHPDLWEMIGLFANTIPIYIEINPAITFKEHLLINKSLVLDDINNGEFQFDEIMKLAFPNGVEKQSSLFNVFLVVQELKLEGATLLGNSLKPYPANNFTTKFDLNFEINIFDNDQYFVIEYSQDNFYFDTICGMADSFCAIITQAISSQDIIIEKIRLHPLEEICHNMPNNESNSTIVSLFMKQVKAVPQQIALEIDGEKVSYDNLNHYANIIAAMIYEKIEKNEIVAVICDRSIFMVVCVLGILKAGGAYLPIDPEYPLDRKNYMLKDCDVRIVFSNAKLTERVNCASIFTEQDFDIAKLTDKVLPNIILRPDDLAYIIYTSGTTGLPKGAMITHANVANLIENNKGKFDFNPSDTWTLFHSLSFDFSVWELFGALLNGSRLIIIPSDVAKDSREFYTLLSKAKVSILSQTPSAFYSLANELAKGKQELDSLKYVIFGGEQLNPLKLRDWKAAYPYAKLINMYGITETTVHVTYKELLEKDLLLSANNIGYPIDNVNVYILDSAMRMCPAGAVGEIYVGGKGVCKGYLNKKPLTAQLFLPDPFNLGKKMYKSGDFAKRLLNGDMIFKGRSDNQVKIRGYRIEVAEIECVLARYPGINETFVILRKEDEENSYIAAYCSMEQEIDTAIIKDYAALFLPEYMIPSYIIKVDYIPRTINGKIDLKKLPVPHEVIDFVPNPDFKLDSVGVRLRLIWAEILSLPIDKVHPKISFFTMGGDSIKAIRLLNAVENEFGKKIKLSALYMNASVLAMSEVIKNEQKVPKAPDNMIINELNGIKNDILIEMEKNNESITNIEDIYPLSDIELGMLYHYIKDDSGHIYHDQMLFQLECDVKFLKTVLCDMTKKHSILRATLNVSDYRESVHIIYKDYEPEIDIRDITHLDKEVQIRIINNCMEKDKMNRFNPPQVFWRLIAFKVNSKTVLFLFVTHHAIIDGWSYSQFKIELNNRLSACAVGQTVDDKPLKNTYKQYIIEQKMIANDTEIAAFWRNELKDFIRLPLPIAADGRAGITDEKQLYDSLQPEVSEGLLKTAERYNTDIKTVYLSAAAYSYNILFGENDYIIGIVNGARPVCEDSEKILGCFLNTFPLRIVIKEEWAYADLLQYIDRKLKRLKGYDKLSLLEIIRKIGLKDKKAPLFDCVFNYVSFDSITEKLNDLGIHDSIRANTILDITADTTFAEPTLRICYDTRLTHELPKRLLAYYKTLLQDFAFNVDAKLGKESILQNDDSLKTIEKLLYDIWCQVLRIEDFDIADNFFELGGDSIKALQVVTKLKNSGFELRINDIFDYKTINELSTKVKAGVQTKDQEPISGESTLSPIQKWFFNNGIPNFNHWNQAFLLYAPNRISTNIIESIFYEIIQHHDILRMRITLDKKKMIINKELDKVTVEEDDYTHYGNEYAKMITLDAERLQASLDIYNGPLMIIKNYATNNGDYLLLIIHHLLIDGVSWRILFEDIAALYALFEKNKPLALPKKTTSYYHFVKSIENYLSKTDLTKEYEYWNKLLSQPTTSLVCGKEKARHKSSDFETLNIIFNENRTSSLAYNCVNELRVSMLSILLYCLGESMETVTNKNSRFQVMLESHGRDKNELDVNINRTIGWFTEIYPFIIKVDMSLPLRERVQIIEHDIKEAALHRLSFSLLTNMALSNDSDKLRSLTDEKIIFNYLGNFDSGMSSTVFTISDINTGSQVDPQSELNEAISISAYIVNDCLRIQCSYDKTYYDSIMIKRLVNAMEQSLHSIIGRCSQGQIAVAEKKVLEGVSGFNEIFINDCFYQALVSAIIYFERNHDFLIGNIFSQYIYDPEQKKLHIKNETVYAYEIFDMLDLLSISYKTMVRCNNVLDEIINQVSSGSLVIVNLDCYYVKNKREMYGRTHWSHSVLAYGYDKESMELYIIDNDDIFTLNYKAKRMSFGELEEAYAGYNIHFNAYSSNASIYILSADKNEAEKISISPKSFLQENLTLVSSFLADSLSNHEKCWQDMKNLQNDFESIKDNIDNLYFIFTSILNAKKIELYKAANIINDQQLIETINTVVENLVYTLNVFRRLMIDKKIRSADISQAIEKFEQALEKEREYNEKLITLSNTFKKTI